MTVTPPSGQCETCAFRRAVSSRAGSTFVLCRRAESDHRFPRYPVLPVLRCDGYRAASSAEDTRPPGR